MEYKRKVAKVVSSLLSTLDERERAEAQCLANQYARIANQLKPYPPAAVAMMIQQNHNPNDIYNLVNAGPFLALAHTIVNEDDPIKTLDKVALSLALGTNVINGDPGDQIENIEVTGIPTLLAAAELETLAATATDLDVNNQPSTTENVSIDNPSIINPEVVTHKYSCALHKYMLGGKPRISQNSEKLKLRMNKLTKLRGSTESSDSDNESSIIKDCILAQVTAEKLSSNIDLLYAATKDLWTRWLSTDSDSDLDIAMKKTREISNLISNAASENQNSIVDQDNAAIQSVLTQMISQAEKLKETSAKNQSAAEQEAILAKRLAFMTEIYNMPDSLLRAILDVDIDLASATKLESTLSKIIVVLKDQGLLEQRTLWNTLIDLIPTKDANQKGIEL